MDLNHFALTAGQGITNMTKYRRIRENLHPMIVKVDYWDMGPMRRYGWFYGWTVYEPCSNGCGNWVRATGVDYWQSCVNCPVE